MANTEFKDIKLDKDQPHGVVFPPERGAHYEQNGFFFDAFGDLAEEMLTDEAKLRLKKHIAKQQAEVAAHKARLKALKAAGFEEDDVAEKVVQKFAELDELAHKAAVGVDLVEWAKGQAKAPWFSVRAAAAEKYSFQAANAENLIEFMLDNGYVGADQVKVL